MPAKSHGAGKGNCRLTFLTDDLMKGTDWRGLERAVARVMCHCGWRDVAVIGQAGDQGADIVGNRLARGQIETWVIQVKAVSRGAYVGVSAVDEVIRAQSLYRADVAAVATNGDFTSSAFARTRDLTDAQFHVRLWNGAFLRGLLEKWPEFNPMRSDLRPYQVDVVERVLDVFRSQKSRAYFVVATGLGKTTIAGEILQELWERGLRRQLVLCHTQDLALQLEQSIWSRISRDIPTSYFFGGRPPQLSEGLMVGLFQTLEGFLDSVDPGSIDVVVVDEAHHALSPTFRKCVEHLSPSFLVGMTATPWRADGNVLDDLFGEPVARVSLVDGMAKGYLADVDYRLLVDNVNWDEVPNISKKKLTIRDLNKRLFLPQRDDAAIEKIKAVMHEVDKPKIAVFSPSIEHCQSFTNLLNGHGIPAASLSGVDRIVRRQNLLDYAAGRLRAVTAVDVLNEGIDVPDVNILVFMRATHSRRIFVQQLGRGLRLAPERNKKKVVVLDFVSDIRRIAEISSINAAVASKTTDKERLWLKDGFVTFSDQHAGEFILEWIRDVSNLEQSNGSHELEFPTVDW